MNFLVGFLVLAEMLKDPDEGSNKEANGAQMGERPQMTNELLPVKREKLRKLHGAAGGNLSWFSALSPSMQITHVAKNRRRRVVIINEAFSADTKRTPRVNRYELARGCFASLSSLGFGSLSCRATQRFEKNEVQG